MISFRYHVVTILAVFLALAVGVALGGGPLSEIGRGNDAARKAEARAADLEQQVAAVEHARTFQDQFAGSLGGGAVDGRLDGRAVSLVVMPGADDDVVQSFVGLVERAGGSVSGRYAVQSAMVDLDEASLVDTLGSQLRSSVADNGVPASATVYERMGGLLGRAVATGSDGGAPLDAAAKEITSSLAGAGLVVPEGQRQLGSVVIVLLGDEAGKPEDIDDMYAGLLAGLDDRPDALVLSGTTDSADEGLLSVLREDPETAGALSSVDSVQTTAGRIATLLAAAADASGNAGHWGALGKDGAVPRG